MGINDKPWQGSLLNNQHNHEKFLKVFFVAQMGPISGWGSNLMLKYMMSFTDLHCKKCCAAFGLVSRSWAPWKFHIALKVWEDVTNVPSWLEHDEVKWFFIGFRCGGKLKWRKSFSKDASWSGQWASAKLRPSGCIFGAWCQRGGYWTTMLWMKQNFFSAKNRWVQAAWWKEDWSINLERSAWFSSFQALLARTSVPNFGINTKKWWIFLMYLWLQMWRHFGYLFIKCRGGVGVVSYSF